MSNVQIPNLPAATSIDGTEQLEAVQSGTSVRITTNQIVDLAVNSTALYPIFNGITPTKNFQNYRILTSDSNKVVEAGNAIADYLTLGTQQTLQGALTLANTSAGSYSVTLQSSNSSTSSAIYTLPPAPAASNGYVLTSNISGVMSWSDPAIIGIDINVNTTAIVGGTSGSLVYDNAGTFGEMSAITTDGASTLTLGIQQTTQGLFVLANTAAGAFPVTVKSSNSTSAAWSLTLPTTAGTNKYALTTDGTGVSSWSQIDLAAAVTGTLPVNHGGTGQATLAQHGVVIGNSASGVNVTATGSSGQVFQSGGAAADPVWSTATYPSIATGIGTILRADGTNWVATTAAYPSSTTINQILYSNSNNNVTGLTTGNGGILNTSSAGVPSITANPILGVQQTTQGSLVLANTAAGAFSTTVKSSNSAIEAWTLTLPVSKGSNGYILTTDGTGLSSWTNPTALGIDIDVNSTAITGGTSGRLVYDSAGTFGEVSAITTNGNAALTLGLQQTTQGSLILANTAAGAFSTTIQSSNSASSSWTLTLPTTGGTNNYVLTTNGSGVSSWSQVSLTAGVTGVLPVANGGTGQTTNTIHGVLLGNAGNAINSTTAGSSGQILQSSGASSDPTWTTASFPSTATGVGTILRADGTNWSATTSTYPTTTSAGTILVSATNNSVTASENPVLGVQQTTQGSLVLANTAAGAFSTTIKSSNVATEAWTLTLPVSKGTNGYILTTDGAGTSSWTNPTSLGIDIDINSTSITSGTSGRLLYDNSATVGEISAITTNGSGALTIGAQQTTQGSVVLANTAVGAFSTTLQSSNSSSAAWTLTLPATGGTNNYVLTTDGSGTSSWSQVSLTAGVTGTLPVINGGTGQATNTIHGVLIGNAGNAINATAAGSAGQLLTSGGASADPLWTTATFPSTATSAGTILRADGTNWSATTATYPTTTSAGTILVSATNNAVTGTATPTLGVQQTTQGQLILANTAAGAFPVTIKSSNSTSASWSLTLPTTAGTSNYSLTTDGTGTTSWSQVSLTAGVTGTLPVGNGGTGTSTAFTAGSIIFAGASGVYSQNNANFFWDNANARLGLGNAAPAEMFDASASGRIFLQATRADGTVNPPVWSTRKARGSVASPTIVSSGDGAAYFQFHAYDGAAYRLASGINIEIDGAPGAGSMPGRYIISTTPSGSTTPVERIRIDSAGNVGIGKTAASGVRLDVSGSIAGSTTILSSGATSGIGYATGAGGSQTQGTSRTTGVTLNNICGAITLFSAAGSTTYQTFTVTNSAVAATDTIIVNQKSGTDKYLIFVTAVAAGSFNITFATTGGTTTEQPVFNFAVIKAVAA